jgi:hypothetical protein
VRGEREEEQRLPEHEPLPSSDRRRLEIAALPVELRDRAWLKDSIQRRVQLEHPPCALVGQFQ